MGTLETRLQPAPPSQELIVEQDEPRLDAYLARVEPSLSRSRIKSLIEDGHVLVEGTTCKPSRRLRPGERLVLTVPPPQPIELQPESIPVHVVYQDNHLLVLDKPAGLSVHPGPGHPAHTLVNALLALIPDLPGIGGYLRPGIVHRLDKDTSGLMVVAKTEAAHIHLSRQLKDRAMSKGYLALTQGCIPTSEGTIDAPLGRHPIHRKRIAVVTNGRTAHTDYRVLQHFTDATYLDVTLHTGRTHQIRVHMAHLGHPLVGDAVYGHNHPLLQRHFLHAHKLAFTHPATGEWVDFTAPLPDDLSELLELFRATETIGRRATRVPSPLKRKR